MFQSKISGSNLNLIPIKERLNFLLGKIKNGYFVVTDRFSIFKISAHWFFYFFKNLPRYLMRHPHLYA